MPGRYALTLANMSFEEQQDRSQLGPLPPQA
jgi:hypothetical protein